MIQIEYILIISALMMFAGIYGFLTRRSTLAILLSIELMLNSADINFAVFNFADMLVCVGAALLIGYLIFDMVRDARKDPLADKETVEQSHESD